MQSRCPAREVRRTCVSRFYLFLGSCLGIPFSEACPWHASHSLSSSFPLISPESESQATHFVDLDFVDVDALSSLISGVLLPLWLRSPAWPGLPPVSACGIRLRSPLIFTANVLRDQGLSPEMLSPTSLAGAAWLLWLPARWPRLGVVPRMAANTGPLSEQNGIIGDHGWEIDGMINSGVNPLGVPVALCGWRSPRQF